MRGNATRQNLYQERHLHEIDINRIGEALSKRHAQRLAIDIQPT
jgi:hypothetical protein